MCTSDLKVLRLRKWFSNYTIQKFNFNKIDFLILELKKLNFTQKQGAGYGKKGKWVKLG